MIVRMERMVILVVLGLAATVVQNPVTAEDGVGESVLGMKRESTTPQVEALGMRDLPGTVIHSDWHPGNMLFRHRKVVAIIDYDSVRRSQRILDVANGTLQFSITAAKRIEDWPAEVDEHRAFSVHVLD